MNNLPLKLAFIGGGLNSVIGQTHIIASRMDGLWQVVAGAFSRDKLINSNTAKKWQVDAKRCYDDWRLMLEKEKENIDAVVIVTPTPLHCEMICAALEKNIPIICEKPVVFSPEELLIIHKIYDPSRHFLVMSYNYSGYPMVRELKEQLNKGFIGAIKNIKIDMPQDIFVKKLLKDGNKVGLQSWRAMSSKIPMICLDLGVHIHHLLYFLLGMEPKSLVTNFNTSGSQIGQVDNVEMWFKYQTDIYASISFSKNSFGQRNALSIHVNGNNGGFYWTQNNAEQLIHYDCFGRQIIMDRDACDGESSNERYNRMKVGHPAGYLEAFANLYCDIAASLRQWHLAGTYDSQFVFSLEHAAAGINLFSKAVESDQKRCWVNIDE